MFKNKFVVFLTKLKIKNYNILYNSVLFYKNTNLAVISYNNYNKKQKFYFFNLIYSYQMSYVYLNNLIYIKFLFSNNFKINNIFILYNKNISKFILFVKNLLNVKNKNLNIFYKNKIKYYEKNIFEIQKFNKKEYLNYYKYQKKIYFNKFFFNKEKIDQNNNYSLANIDYYFQDIFFPEFEEKETKEIYKHNIIKKNLTINFLKLKNNFIDYNFFKNIIFFNSKLKFLDNFKNIIFFLIINYFLNFLNFFKFFNLSFLIFYSFLYQKNFIYNV